MSNNETTSHRISKVIWAGRRWAR